jgi:hypothetical protein
MKKNITQWMSLACTWIGLSSLCFAQGSAIPSGMVFELESPEGKVVLEGPVMTNSEKTLTFTFTGTADLAKSGAKGIIHPPKDTREKIKAAMGGQTTVVNQEDVMFEMQNIAGKVVQEGVVKVQVNAGIPEAKFAFTPTPEFITGTPIQVTVKPPKEQGIRQKVSRAQSDMRSLATACEAYFVDNNAYPVCSTGANSMNALPHPSFRILTATERGFMTITTPVAYITSYPADPFGEPKKTYSYYSDKKGWLLWSVGPDGKYDITGDQVAQLYQGQMPMEQTRLKLLNYTYDATNGATSSGDIFRLHQ